jgi:hypothetical protein
MSKPPTTEELRAVIRAIDLRAEGYSWNQVALRLKVDIDEVREWPTRYAEFWVQRSAVAHRELDEEVLGETRAILRARLRGDKVKEVCDVARILFDHARRSLAPTADSPPAPSELECLVDHLEGLSHDDLRAYVDIQLARLAGDGTDDRDRPKLR